MMLMEGHAEHKSYKLDFPQLQRGHRELDLFRHYNLIQIH